MSKHSGELTLVQNALYSDVTCGRCVHKDVPEVMHSTRAHPAAAPLPLYLLQQTPPYVSY